MTQPRPRPTPRTVHVTVNGARLLTREIGQGPDIIVLHGGPGAHHDYLLPQYDALARNRRLRYYDQRGGGGSPVDRNVPVGWREHVADLDALVAHWGLERATILGYSWGGLLAMLYTIAHPAKVERLALVAPASVTEEGRQEFERRFAERMQSPRVTEARRLLQASGLRERDADAYRRRAFELSVAGYFKDPDRASELTPFRVTARTQQKVWDSLAGYDLREDLASLSIPALVVHGMYDPIPIETAEETAGLLHARLERFANSGHAPHVEEYDRFVEVLDEFLPPGA